MPTDGCPCCDWDGQIAETHDRTREYFTHVIVKRGEVFRGKTCNRPSHPTRRSFLRRLLE